jgi:uncharacterized metal-binding protein YceD (DUF177 family)
MIQAEFSRPIDTREADGKRVRLTAGAAERAALAKRFGIVRIDRLEAEVALDRASGGAFAASGRLAADIVQSCAVSAEDLPVTIDEALSFRFVPAAAHPHDEEVELDAADCDEIEYSGTSFDLGEAVAQSLALAIDPFAVGPAAEAARREAGLLGEDEAGPFAALKGLLKDD